MMRIAILGATGIVGQEFLKLWSKTSSIVPDIFGSPRSAGKRIPFGNEVLPVRPFKLEQLRDYSCVFLFTGEDFSRKWARTLAAVNRLVIDTSGFWRMEADVPLIIAEINGAAMDDGAPLIASPNCITILPLMALWPLHRQFGLSSVLATTFQSVSGSGVAGEITLREEAQTWPPNRSSSSPYRWAIHGNLIPQIGAIQPDGYSDEEHALECEARKIFCAPELKISATCVRVPVFRGHAMAIQAAFRSRPSLSQVKTLWQQAVHLILDEASTPLEVVGKDRYFISRLRRDRALENGIAFWLVADQTICGAAMNVINIFRLRFGTP